MNGKLTHDDVKKLAYENNYNLLYRCIEMFQAGQCTWEEAMQIAAIEYAKEVSRIQKELIRIYELKAFPSFPIP